MEELKDLKQRLEQQRPDTWGELPDIPLYMDQVVSYLSRQMISFEEGDSLTPAMINNYIKDGLLDRANGKKYGQEHLAYLTAICILKRVMSARDMDMLIHEELQGDRTVEDGYAAFCASLDKALNLAAAEMDQRPESDTLADAAIHFALLSYAAGLASSRYVALLRQEQAEAEPPRSSKARNKKEKERD